VNLHLHIDKLVLDGLAVNGSPAVLRAALEGELTRLLTLQGPGAAIGLGAVDRLRAPPIRGPQRVDAGEWGRRIAGSVHAGLTAGAGAATGEAGKAGKAGAP
jgi:hypothetical protein